jgi:threonine/homoserine/homoserine lactone efflux protein
MLGIHDFGVFVVAAIVLNLTPGQDTLYITGRTMAQGRGAGIASVLGISSGCLIHTLLAAAGISAVLAHSAAAFFYLKVGGAIYLIYLGLRLLVGAPAVPASVHGIEAPRFVTIYRQGVLTNLLNPKVALFFLAFMPQFIGADSTAPFWAFITLGLVFITTGTIWCFVLVWLSGLMVRKLHGSRRIMGMLNYSAGLLFIWLGIRLVRSA